MPVIFIYVAFSFIHITNGCKIDMFKKLLIRAGILKVHTVKVRKIHPDVIKGHVDDAWLKEAYQNMSKDEPEHYRMLKRQGF